MKLAQENLNLQRDFAEKDDVLDKVIRRALNWLKKIKISHRKSMKVWKSQKKQTNLS